MTTSVVHNSNRTPSSFSPREEDKIKEIWIGGQPSGEQQRQQQGFGGGAAAGKETAKKSTATSTSTYPDKMIVVSDVNKAGLGPSDPKEIPRGPAKLSLSRDNSVGSLAEEGNTEETYTGTTDSNGTISDTKDTAVEYDTAIANGKAAAETVNSEAEIARLTDVVAKATAEIRRLSGVVGSSSNLDAATLNNIGSLEDYDDDTAIITNERGADQAATSKTKTRIANAGEETAESNGKERGHVLQLSRSHSMEDAELTSINMAGDPNENSGIGAHAAEIGDVLMDLRSEEEIVFGSNSFSRSEEEDPFQTSISNVSAFSDENNRGASQSEDYPYDNLRASMTSHGSWFNNGNIEGATDQLTFMDQNGNRLRTTTPVFQSNNPINFDDVFQRKASGLIRAILQIQQAQSERSLAVSPEMVLPEEDPEKGIAKPPAQSERSLTVSPEILPEEPINEREDRFEEEFNNMTTQSPAPEATQKSSNEQAEDFEDEFNNMTAGSGDLEVGCRQSAELELSLEFQESLRCHPKRYSPHNSIHSAGSLWDNEDERPAPLPPLQPVTYRPIVSAAALRRRSSRAHELLRFRAEQEYEEEMRKRRVLVFGAICLLLSFGCGGALFLHFAVDMGDYMDELRD